MGVAVEPWQTAEIPGPKKALSINNPQIVTSLIKRSKNPIIVVGHKAAEIQLKNGLLIDYIIRISEKAGIPIVSTPSLQSEFIKRGFSRVVGMPFVDIANRLVDPEWMGLEGKGMHDLAIFVGFTYYVGWLILSGLKHFSPQIKTVSIDMHYQPHASWSLPNMSLNDWEKNLEALIEGLEVK
jgi:acetyl-CoA decarbonylase/synthase complex subunit epsilon